jgi:hypothetical protein
MPYQPQCDRLLALGVAELRTSQTIVTCIRAGMRGRRDLSRSAPYREGVNSWRESKGGTEMQTTAREGRALSSRNHGI